MRALLSMAAMLSLGCEDRSEPATQPRRDAVTASVRPSASASAPRPAASVGPRRAGPLCVGQSARDKPGDIAEARTAGGASKPVMRFGDGRWTWINVWAGWCGPCKEEMPRLLAWRDQLIAEGHKVDLHFVSIDDDERELMRFIESQPERGVRASLWLGAEDAREEWFTSIGFDEQPTLPVHAFVSPAGKLTCTVTGALEPEDYPELQKIFKG